MKSNAAWSGITETWRRLGRIDLTSKPVLYSLIFAHIFTVFGFEIGRIGTNPFLVLAIALMAEVLFWASYLTLYAIQIWLLRDINSVFSKVFIILASNTVRIVALELSYYQFGLQPDLGITERFLGDTTGVIMLLIGIAYMQVVMSELGAQEAEVARVKQDLEKSGLASKASAEGADAALRARAQQVLGDQLNAISEYLKSAKAPKAKRLSEEIQLLIKNKVRPLSVELRQRLEVFSATTIEENGPIRSRLPQAIFPALDFRPGVAFLFAGLNIFVTTPGLSDWPTALVFGFVTLSFPILGILLARLYPRQAIHNLWCGAGMVGLGATLAWLPSLSFLILSSASHPQLMVLSFTSTVVIIFSSVAVAFWSAFKRERVAYLEEIAELTEERARQLAILDQAVWVSRRNWSYLVHGTVQGALTVALSRLQLAKVVTPELIAEVLRDIERAKSALEAETGFSQDWAQVLSEIKQTWAGVCTLEEKVTGPAKKLLSTNPSAAMCATEIVKELVSNSFRHGGASAIALTIAVDEVGDLLLSATNNGAELSSEIQNGIGTQMFSDLTSSWSWKNTPKGVRFSATIPVSPSP